MEVTEVTFNANAFNANVVQSAEDQAPIADVKKEESMEVDDVDVSTLNPRFYDKFKHIKTFNKTKPNYMQDFDKKKMDMIEECATEFGECFSKSRAVLVREY